MSKMREKRTVAGQSPADPIRGNLAAPANRRTAAVESFGNAANAIGPVSRGMSVFVVSRGQFSMSDAVRHVVDSVGPCRVTLWTWTVADYDLLIFAELYRDGRLTDGMLVIDGSVRAKNAALIDRWQKTFGPESVRYVRNHAKIATVEGGGYRVLLRGSMNLNFNPRFEQLDVTEGGPDFDLISSIEAALPVLSDDCSSRDIGEASKVGEGFDANTLEVFAGVKVWAK